MKLHAELRVWTDSNPRLGREVLLERKAAVDTRHDREPFMFLMSWLVRCGREVRDICVSRTVAATTEPVEETADQPELST